MKRLALTLSVLLLIAPVSLADVFTVTVHSSESGCPCSASCDCSLGTDCDCVLDYNDTSALSVDSNQVKYQVTNHCSADRHALMHYSSQQSRPVTVVAPRSQTYVRPTVREVQYRPFPDPRQGTTRDTTVRDRAVGVQPTYGRQAWGVVGTPTYAPYVVPAGGIRFQSAPCST